MDYKAALAARALRKSKREERKRDNAALGAKTVKRGKKKKSPSLSKLKKILWEVLRFVVYAESPDRCITCGSDAPPVACHIVPSGDGAVIRFFLPAIYRGCRSCNDDERRHRGRWRGKFEEIFGRDFVAAFYAMSEEESQKPPAEKFQIKKHWVLEQTARMQRILEGENKG